MNDQVVRPAPAFGGRWTEEKLAILERYLDTYTTALKDKPFRLWYIDAFAGTGRVELSADDQREIRRFVSGSAERAINIEDKPFDKLVFVEQDNTRFAELEVLKEMNTGRDIMVENSDANEYIRKMSSDWTGRRGVLFLDPFATQVEFATLERVASFNALDMWILFPVSAISRILPTSQRPNEINDKWAARLTTVYGDESWHGLYRPSPQLTLFGSAAHERDKGVNGLLEIYKNKLTDLFGDRFLHQSRSLKNSKNSTLFEFLFCAGNPRGASIAKRIAKHILMKGL